MRIDNPTGFTSNLTGSFTGSFFGDGSGLTGTDSGSWDGDFTGSAEITGSLRITGSLDTTDDATFGGSISASNLSGTNSGDQTNITGNAGTVTNGVYTIGNQTIAGVKTFSGDIIRKGNVGNISFEAGSVANINAQIQYDQVNDTTGQLFFKTANSGTLATRLTISSDGAATFGGALSGTSASFSELKINSTGTEMVNINVVDNSSRQGIRLNNGINSSSGIVVFNSASSTGTTTGGLFVIDQASSSLVQPTIVVKQSGTGDFLQFKEGATSKLTISSAGDANFSGNVGIGVDAHGTASLNITNSDQHIRLNNGSELGIINLDSDGKLDIWAHGLGETINFITGTGSGTVAMSVVGTDVGIGTDSPRPVGTGYKALEINSGTSGGSSIWLSSASDAYNAYIAVDSGGLNMTAITGMSLTLGTSNSPRLTISSGGTAAFSSPNTTANVAMVTIRSTDSQGANVGGTLGLGGSYGAGLVNYALIRGAKETGTYNDSNGYMSFTVHSSAGEVERMRITSAGQLSVSSSGEFKGLFKNTNTTSGQHCYVDINSSSTSGNAILRLTTPARTATIQNDGDKLQLVNGGALYIDARTNTSYTSDGLWSSAATPMILRSASGFGIYLGYQDNGSGLYAPAYGFLSKSTDGLGNTVNREVIQLKDNSSGQINFSVSNLGAVIARGTVTSNGNPSDIRLKENIKPIDSALNKISKLQGVAFDWKPSDSITQLGIKEDYGFIAQEVQKSLPEIIKEDQVGMLSMRYNSVIPILVEGIKELEKVVNDLKEEILELKKK